MPWKNIFSNKLLLPIQKLVLRLVDLKSTTYYIFFLIKKSLQDGRIVFPSLTICHPNGFKPSNMEDVQMTEFRLTKNKSIELWPT